jgi:hypothetical protein
MRSHRDQFLLRSSYPPASTLGGTGRPIRLALDMPQNEACENRISDNAEVSKSAFGYRQHQICPQHSLRAPASTSLMEGRPLEGRSRGNDTPVRDQEGQAFIFAVGCRQISCRPMARPLRTELRSRGDV